MEVYSEGDKNKKGDEIRERISLQFRKREEEVTMKNNDWRRYTVERERVKETRRRKEMR